jgi:putative nucleotidyltransferase with HDIG domain
MNPLEVSVSVPQEIKEGVVASLPLINEIQDEQLRAGVIEGWGLSLILNGFTRIEELQGSGMPGAPVVGDQTHHLMGVARIALGIKESLELTLGEEIAVDKDTLIAAALCHDLGKTYEYNPKHRERWAADPRVSGKPALRHPAYGAYIALLVGLPEGIVHVAGCHSPEGRFVERSLAATIVHHADDSYWFVLESALAWEQKVPRL